MKHDVRVGVLGDAVCQRKRAEKGGGITYNDDVDCPHVNVTSATGSGVIDEDLFDCAAGGSCRLETRRASGERCLVVTLC